MLNEPIGAVFPELAERALDEARNGLRRVAAVAAVDVETLRDLRRLIDGDVTEAEREALRRCLDDLIDRGKWAGEAL